jgi:hypothetical protein
LVAYPVTISDPLTDKVIPAYKVITHNDPKDVVNVPLQDVCCWDLRVITQKSTEESTSTTKFDEQLQALAPQAKVVVITNNRYWEDFGLQEITINLNDPAVQEFITQARRQIETLDNSIQIANRLNIYVRSLIKTNNAITSMYGPRNLTSILQEGDVCFGKAFWLDVLMQQISSDLNPRIIRAKVFTDLNVLEAISEHGALSGLRQSVAGGTYHTFVIFQGRDGIIRVADPFNFRETMSYSQYCEEAKGLEIVKIIRWQPD